MNSLVSTLRPRLVRLSRAASEPLARATSPLRMLPDFVIVGAQRAGTTSLYKYLAEHPDVGRVRLGKGVHYFDTSADRSMSWYRSHFPLDAGRIPFKERPSHVGEGCPYYMFHPYSPARINAALPGVKVIAILRDPVERAHSQWVHETARGYETLTFEQAVRLEEERLADQEDLLGDPAGRSFSHQHHSYVSRGQYAAQIQRLWGVFGHDRVLLIPSSELFAEPQSTYASVLSFLGLTPHQATYEVHNARSYSKLEPSVERWLSEQFAASNEELVTLLGPRFDFRRG